MKESLVMSASQQQLMTAVTLMCSASSVLIACIFVFSTILSHKHALVFNQFSLFSSIKD